MTIHDERSGIVDAWTMVEWMRHQGFTLDEWQEQVVAALMQCSSIYYGRGWHARCQLTEAHHDADLLMRRGHRLGALTWPMTSLAGAEKGIASQSPLPSD